LGAAYACGAARVARHVAQPGFAGFALAPPNPRSGLRKGSSDKILKGSLNMKICLHGLRFCGVIAFAAAIYLFLCAPGFLSDASSTVPVSSEDSP
jgi:hypothetical protein